jgi:hypothetical protein
MKASFLRSIVYAGLVLLALDSNAELIGNASYTTDARTNLDCWI